MTELPRSTKSWTSLVWKLASALAAAIIVIAILVEFLILNRKAADASTQALHAGTTAQDVASCVNSVLADRGKVSDTPAVIEAIEASSNWADAVLALFANPPDPSPAQQKAEGKAFLDATTAYSKHLVHAAQALNANAGYRKRHPLGQC